MTRNTKGLLIQLAAILVAMIVVAAWGCSQGRSQDPFSLVVHDDVSQIATVPAWARVQERIEPPRPDDTEFQSAFQDALNQAGEIARRKNKTVTLVVAPGEFDFVELKIPQHVSMIADPPVARSTRLRYIGGNGKTWIELGKGGYGSTMAGFELVDATGQASDCTAIDTNGAINPRLSDLRIVQKGADCVALYLKGRESIIVERCELRSSVPVRYGWGDNICLSHSDLGASGNVRDYPSAVFWMENNPNQITLDGSCTAQGGDYLVYGRTDEPRTGQNLLIIGCRWEQSTSTDDPEKYAIDIACNNRAFENLTLIGCRWTQRKAGVKIRYNPSYPLVPRFESVGCFLPGGVFCGRDNRVGLASGNSGD